MKLNCFCWIILLHFIYTSIPNPFCLGLVISLLYEKECVKGGRQRERQVEMRDGGREGWGINRQEKWKEKTEKRETEVRAQITTKCVCSLVRLSLWGPIWVLDPWSEWGHFDWSSLWAEPSHRVKSWFKGQSWVSVQFRG